MAKCWNCGREGAPDESHSCEPCASAHQAYVDEMEESYQQAREERIARQQAEYQEWREQRYQERLAEQERQRADRDAYREELIAREWERFQAGVQARDSLEYSLKYSEFQRSLEQRYEWLR